MAEETMNDFKDEIDRSFRKVKEGDILEGTVIDVSDTEITLDLKYYTQGIIRVSDMSDDPKFSVHRDVKIGDEVSATVISTDDGNGNILLSKKEANHVLAWDKLKEYMDAESYVDVKVSESVKGGCVAFLEGIRGFIPMSRMAARAQLDIEKYRQSMNGIYTTSVSEATIDEAPMAYKPMKEIVRNIEPTVTIEKIIKPVYNFKAAE